MSARKFSKKEFRVLFPTSAPSAEDLLIAAEEEVKVAEEERDADEIFDPATRSDGAFADAIAAAQRVPCGDALCAWPDHETLSRWERPPIPLDRTRTRLATGAQKSA